MANEARKASTFPACTAPQGADSLVALTTATIGNNALITVNNFFANVQTNVVVSNAASLIVRGSNTPTNSTFLASVIKGTVWFDGSHIYVSTANGHTKRAPLTDFPGDIVNGLPGPTYYDQVLLANVTNNTAYWGNAQNSNLLLPTDIGEPGEVMLLNDNVQPTWVSVPSDDTDPLQVLVSMGDGRWFPGTATNTPHVANDSGTAGHCLTWMMNAEPRAHGPFGDPIHDVGTRTWGPTFSTVIYPVSETDLLAGTTQHFTILGNYEARVTSIWVYVQKAITTGGTLTFKRDGVVISAIAVANGATAGTQYNDDDLSHDLTIPGTRRPMTIEIADFATAGAVNIVFEVASGDPAPNRDAGRWPSDPY